MSYLAMMRRGGSLNARELKVADLKKATDCDPNYSTFWKRRRYGNGRPSQMALVIKTPPANARDIRHRFDPSGVGMILWRRAWQPTPVFLPRESQGQSSPVSHGL